MSSFCNERKRKNTIRKNNKYLICSPSKTYCAIPSVSASDGGRMIEISSDSPGEKSVQQAAAGIVNGKLRLQSKACHIENGQGDETSESDSDSTLWKRDVFFIKRENTRCPYTEKEDLEILNYVLQGNNIQRTSSLSLWRELEQEKFQADQKRTYQSLKNRFLRNIKPLLFTKYASYLNDDKRKKIKCKFPELKSPKKKPSAVVRLQPCPRSLKLLRSAPLSSSERSTSLQDEDEENHKSHKRFVHVACKELTTRCNVRSFKDVGVGEEMVFEDSLTNTQTDIIGDSQAKTAPLQTVVMRDVKTETKAVSTSDDPPLPTLEVYATEKLSDVPVQTFRYSKMMTNLSGETNFILNLVFVNDTSNEDLLFGQDVPLKVDVVVNVSRNQETTSKAVKSNNECMASNKINDSRVNGKRKMKKKPGRNVFKLRVRNSARKLRRLSPQFKEELAQMLSKMKEVEVKRRESLKKSGNKPSDTEEKTKGMVLRSRSLLPKVNTPRKASEDCSDVEVIDSGDSSSTDDESAYTEIYRQVRRRYQVVIESDSLDEKESGKKRSSQSEKDSDDCENSQQKTKLLSNMMNMLNSASATRVNAIQCKKNLAKKL